METLFLFLNLMYYTSLPQASPQHASLPTASPQHASLPTASPLALPQDTLYPGPWVCDPPTCSGDFNCDSIRGVTDILMIITAFGIDDSGDIYGNGMTDISDLVYLLSKFGIHCDGTDLQP